MSTARILVRPCARKRATRLPPMNPPAPATTTSSLLSFILISTYYLLIIYKHLNSGKQPPPFEANPFCASRALHCNPASRRLSQAEELQRYQKYKFRSANQIAAPEAAGLLKEPKEPFEAMLAEPGRCLRDLSGVKIERGSDTDQNRHIEGVPVVEHPALLFWSTQAHPEYVRTGAINQGNLFGVFCRS